MRGILVDTSVWIDFFSGIKSKEEAALNMLIENEDPLFLCPTIIQEVLQGFRSDEDFKLAQESLLAYPIATPDSVQISINAADLNRRLRQKGVTIRKSNDTRIAAVAIEESLQMLFRDPDFALIADHCELEILRV